ncbi:hypothetical protein PQQ96_21220 [Paraburkholderia sediminicola]|uniref:hypothetical protein n=1 Tax=Paraburkholderia sediminicola TaxID=458836 RepID=UPI0038B9E0E8
MKRNARSDYADADADADADAHAHAHAHAYAYAYAYAYAQATATRARTYTGYLRMRARWSGDVREVALHRRAVVETVNTLFQGDTEYGKFD